MLEILNLTDAPNKMRGINASRRPQLESTYSISVKKVFTKRSNSSKDEKLRVFFIRVK